MKKIIEFTKVEAMYIAKLLGKEYNYFRVWGDKAMIAFKYENNKREESLYVQATGQISFIYNDGQPGGSGYEDINTLPITDYLRSQGFEFEYSIPK